MNYKTTVFLSIALGAVLLIAAIAGMRYMNPAPEGYRSSFETAKEQATPQPTQTATPKPTEEPFTGLFPSGRSGNGQLCSVYGKLCIV